MRRQNVLAQVVLGVYRYVIELEREGGFTDEEIARIEADGHLECLGRYAQIER